MKKIIKYLLILLLTVGCTKKDTVKDKINTIIEENKNFVIGINYPITGYKNLDNKLKEDINEIHHKFIKEYETDEDDSSELNIDYTYDIVNERYINICIHIFINNSNLAHPINELKTYVYDIKEKNIITIKNIIDENEMEKFASLVTNEIIKNYNKCILLDEIKGKITSSYESYPLYTFDDTNISIYFNPAYVTSSYCNIIEVTIPLSKIKTKINIKKDTNEVSKQNVETKKYVIDPKEKVIAITFDDGPSTYTNDIIEYLNKENARATFFILGNKVSIYKDTINKALKYGNEIGNHSYNHKWLTKLSIEEMLLQIEKTQAIIEENTGYTPVSFRPTYGSINNTMRKNVNLNIVLWTVDTMDWKYKSVDKIVSRATSKVKDGDIILMHDTHERTYKALLKIVPELKRQGFTFVTISELKEIELLRKEIKKDK